MLSLESMGIAPRKVAEFKQQEVQVTVPARLHATVLDMNRFNLNRPRRGRRWDRYKGLFSGTSSID